MPVPHRFLHRVRYAEVDQMGVAYHSRYLEWFEAARTEMLREMGMPYARIEQDGLLLPVIEAHCCYRQPVRYDDLVTIHTCVEKISRVRLHLTYEVRDEKEKVCVSGETLHCFVGPCGKPVRADKALIALIKSGSTF